MSKKTLFWVSRDDIGSIHMGDYFTTKKAIRAIPGAREECIRECGNDTEEKRIRDGYWMVAEPDGSWVYKGRFEDAEHASSAFYSENISFIP